MVSKYICLFKASQLLYNKQFSTCQCLNPVTSFFLEEPKEEEMTEEEKAAQKAKPVATTPIPGTPWQVMIFPTACTVGLRRQEGCWVVRTSGSV